MSSLVKDSKKQQNYPVYIQDNWLTVIENIYDNSTNNEREESATVILLLCVYLLLFVEGCIVFHTKELIAIKKLLK